MAESTTQVNDIVYSLCASPDFAEDGVCFSARGSGLYRSDDRGDTWHNAYDALKLEAPLATLAVALSPDFPSDQGVYAGVPGGILRSSNGGKSWFIETLRPPPPVVSSLVISPNFAQDGVLLAGTNEDGVFRSADRGRHWSAWNFGLLDLNVLCMVISPDFAQDETLLVGTETGIFRSTNGGRAWREMDFPTAYAPVLSLAMSADYAQRGGALLAGTELYGLFRSTDGGRSWSRLGEETITDAVNAIIATSEHSTELDLLVALSDRLYVSRDGGTPWSDWQTGLTFERGLASVAAPQGLDSNAPLLLGLVDGTVARI
jgi:photosystem II stability/assembly factor-like uncharacterized protein